MSTQFFGGSRQGDRLEISNSKRVDSTSSTYFLILNTNNDHIEYYDKNYYSSISLNCD